MSAPKPATAHTGHNQRRLAVLPGPAPSGMTAACVATVLTVYSVHVQAKKERRERLSVGNVSYDRAIVVEAVEQTPLARSRYRICR
jgi:hypothetical protein